MILKLPVRFEGPHGDVVLYTLFDSGATLSCIHPDHVLAVGPTTKMKTPLIVGTADSNSYLTIAEKIIPEFYIDDIRLSDEFMVVPGLSEDAIIGAATMQKWRIKLDFEHDKVIIDPRVAEIMLKQFRWRVAEPDGEEKN
jgi:predicted aspartyl protease